MAHRSSEISHKHHEITTASSIPKINLLSTDYSDDCRATDSSITCILDEKTITIAGKGKMKDFREYSPWYSDHPTTVIIGGEVETIGAYAFYYYGTSSITNIQITTQSLQTIGYRAFNSANFQSITLPDSLTKIDQYAFASCKELTTVTFGKNLTTIEQGAFISCSKLSIFSLPEKLTYIGTYGFAYCDGITNLTIPDSVLTLDEHAFKECQNLVELIIGNGVRKLEDQFENCIKLTTVSIGSGLGSFSFEYPFSSCDSIKVFKVSKENEAFSSPDGVLCSSSILYRYPPMKTDTSYTVPFFIKKFDSNAFKSCSYLTSITIPHDVETINEMTFYGLTNLQTVIIESTVKTIEAAAFSGCTGLSTILLPSGITKISKFLLRGCSSLTNIIIPENVETIEQGAFENCNSLISISIPDKVQTIGTEAFKGCTSLKNIIFGRGIQTINSDSFSSCENIKCITYKGTNSMPTGDYFPEASAYVNANYYSKSQQFLGLSATKMDDGQVFYESEGQCVANCDDDEGYSGTGSTCTKCSGKFVSKDGNSCVNDCSGMYINSKGNQCTEKCNGDEYISLDGKSCLKKCPEHQGPGESNKCLPATMYLYCEDIYSSECNYPNYSPIKSKEVDFTKNETYQIVIYLFTYIYSNLQVSISSLDGHPLTIVTKKPSSSQLLDTSKGKLHILDVTYLDFEPSGNDLNARITQSDYSYFRYHATIPSHVFPYLIVGFWDDIYIGQDGELKEKVQTIELQQRVTNSRIHLDMSLDLKMVSFTLSFSSYLSNAKTLKISGYTDSSVTLEDIKKVIEINDENIDISYSTYTREPTYEETSTTTTADQQQEQQQSSDEDNTVLIIIIVCVVVVVVVVIIIIIVVVRRKKKKNTNSDYDEPRL